MVDGQKMFQRTANLDQPFHQRHSPYALLDQPHTKFALFLDCDGTLLDIARPPTPCVFQTASSNLCNVSLPGSTAQWQF